MEIISDEEFMEFIILERMQQCYACWENNTKDRHKDIDKIEEAYKTAISMLSEQDKNAIKKYFDSVFNDSISKASFFYRSGVKDGYYLHCSITNPPTSI